MKRKTTFISISKVLICAAMFLANTACMKNSSIIAGDETGRTGRDNSIALSGNTIYTAFYDAVGKDLKICVSKDKGQTWSDKDVYVIEKTGGLSPSIAVAGNTLYAAYFKNKKSEAEVAFAKSTDTGRTWEPENKKTVDKIKGNRKFTSIAVQDDYIYIAYCSPRDNEVRVAVSEDGGVTWKKENIHIVDGSAVSRGGWYPSIAAVGNDLYLAYNGAYNGRGRGKSLRFARSSDRGKTWSLSDIKEIDGPECSLGLHTAIAAKGNDVYISYTAKGKLKLAVSSDKGVTWEKKVIESHDKTDRFGFTDIVLSGTHVCVAYKLNSALKFVHSPDKGNTWPPQNFITINKGSVNKKGKPEMREQRISMATSGSEVYMSFYDSKNKGLAIISSSDDGMTWNSGL